MKIELMNIDKFIAVNQLQEVTNPIVLDHSYKPMPDGILSTDIFGATIEERRRTFAYIDLHCHIFQPLIFKTLKRIERKIVDIISGTKTFSIDNHGQLIEDEKGNTGLEWLYKNWSKIKFKKNDSYERNQRITLIENSSKDQIFQSKEIVIPAFYRDVNIHSSNSSKPAIEKINAPYTKLIRYANTLNQGDFTFNLNYNRYQIQLIVLEIYDELKSRVEKKRGLIRKNLLGKTVDYGARLIISQPKFTAERPSEMLTDFYHAGVPLEYCVSCFTPFFIGWIQKFFQHQVENMGFKMGYYDAKTKQIISIELKDPLLQFTDDKIHNMMKVFIKSPGNRFDPIYLETEDKKNPMKPFKFIGSYNRKIDEKISNRPFTLTDLFYLAAEDICSDKFVYITRYPITDYAGIFPCGISVLSTIDTDEVVINDKVYKHYPQVDVTLAKKDIGTRFIEVLNMQNTYLQALNGDYDGDQITVKGVFSQEANEEANEIMHSVKNIMNTNCHNKRTTTIEAIQTCYSVSRWKNPNEKF